MRSNVWAPEDQRHILETRGSCSNGLIRMPQVRYPAVRRVQSTTQSRQCFLLKPHNLFCDCQKNEVVQRHPILTAKSVAVASSEVASCRAVLKSETFGQAVRLLHLSRIFRTFCAGLSCA
jgi:hypothetical protein